MAKTYDGTYVSSQKHEVNYIARHFLSPSGEYAPTPLIYFMLNEMSMNKGVVSRVEFYSVLRLLGYKKI